MRAARPAAPLVFALALTAGACANDRAPVAPASDQPAGAVVAVEGQVTARRAAAGAPDRPLATAAEVYGDDTVTTAAAASVKILLKHNEVTWTLEGGQSRRLDQSLAWKAPKGAAPEALVAPEGDHAAAGRHAEKEAADTAATAQRRPAEGTVAPPPGGGGGPPVMAAPAPPPPVAAPPVTPPQPVTATPSPPPKGTAPKASAPARRTSVAAAPSPAPAPPPAPAAEPAPAPPPPPPPRMKVAAPPAAQAAAPAPEAVAAPAPPPAQVPPPADQPRPPPKSSAAPAPSRAADRASGAPAPKPPASGTVALGTLEVQGGLDASSVSGAISARLGQFRSCYQAALVANAGLAGSAVLSFVVSASGSVANVTVTGDVSGELKACVSARARSVTFATAGAETRVRVALVFKAEP